MTTREEAIFYCKTFKNVIEDYPFHESNWALMCHSGNKKTFACIYERMISESYELTKPKKKRK